MVIQDVSHTRRLTRQLSYQASHDLLTGLYNRRKFEEYLDDHDVYLFNGWEEAKVLKPINVERFWVEILVWFGPDADLRGATRLTNDKEAQNSVQMKKLGDHGYILKFRVLKRYLDAIEQRSKERAEQLSDEQLEQMS